MPKPLIGLGFKNFNCILNLGNTGQILGLNFLLLSIMIISLILYKLKRSKHLNRIARTLKEKIIYGPFLGLAYNAYIPLFLSYNLNIQHDLHTFDGKKN